MTSPISTSAQQKTELENLSLGAGLEAVEELLGKQLGATPGVQDARELADLWFDYLVPVFQDAGGELSPVLAQRLRGWVRRHWAVDRGNLDDVARFCALLDGFEVPGAEALMEEKLNLAEEDVAKAIRDWLESEWGRIGVVAVREGRREKPSDPYSERSS